MTIYLPTQTEGYEFCHPEKSDDYETLNLLINGEPRRNSWTSIRMKLDRSDQGRKLLDSGSPWLGEHALIFKPKAVAVLKESLEGHGELLPLECLNAHLAIYNPTRVIDALNEEASKVQRFKDGRIMWIKHHVFRADVIGNTDLFKIPNLRVSPTFLSRRVVDLWSSANLVGIEFREIWSSE